MQAKVSGAGALAAPPNDSLPPASSATHCSTRRGERGEDGEFHFPNEEGALNDHEVTHYRWDAMPKEELSPSIQRRLVSGDRLMLAHVYLAQGAVVPRHGHENEQFTYILRGKLRFWLGDDGEDVVDVSAGEVLHIPANVPHEAEALEDTLDLDVFSPPRQDWLDGTDAYLRGGGDTSARRT